jgi:hypothetical protein
VKNYKVQLTTCYKHLRPQVSENTLYGIIDSLEKQTETLYDKWMDTDDLILPYGGYPFKITKMKFNKQGELVSLELTELS